MIKVYLPTWACGSCGYAQDFEPTKENMEHHFNKDKGFPLSDVEANECPSCGLKGERGKSMVKETRPERKAIVIIAGEEEADALQLEDGSTEIEEEVETGRYITIAGTKHPVREKVKRRTPKYRNATQAEKDAKREELRRTLAYWQARADN